MPVIGKPRVFQKKFKFIIEIDSVAHAGFQSCSALETELAEVTYHEGGAITPDKSPGRQTFSDITLMRGAVTGDSDLYNWFQLTSDAAAQAGAVEPLFKRTLDIVQLDRDGSELRRWRVFGAWPKKFTAGDWDNEADENVIEQIVLAIDRFEKTAG